jgi:hypothetical protein
MSAPERIVLMPSCSTSGVEAFSYLPNHLTDLILTFSANELWHEHQNPGQGHFNFIEVLSGRHRYESIGASKKISQVDFLP